MSGPLAQLFRRYSAFDYSAANSASVEFRRLCSVEKWNEQERKEARDAFQDALTKQFNLNYGRIIKNLGSWQFLCTYIGVEPLPDSIEECRKTVKRTHVNIVDLVDVFGTNRRVHVFATAKELSEYTKGSDKFFPRRNLHAGDLLKYMLRKIWCPPPDSNGTNKAPTRGKRAKVKAKSRK